MKKITRTYKTKSGKVVTKTYFYYKKYAYEKSDNKSPLLIDRRGGVRKKTVEKLKKEIMDQARVGKLGYDEAEYAVYELDYYLEERAGKKKRLRVSGFYGHLSDTAVERMFLNAGSNVQEEAAWLGVSPEALGNENNWHGDVFTDSAAGKSWRFTFGYGGIAQWKPL